MTKAGIFFIPWSQKVGPKTGLKPNYSNSIQNNPWKLNVYQTP